jgi:hypothetical protein
MIPWPDIPTPWMCGKRIADRFAIRVHDENTVEESRRERSDKTLTKLLAAQRARAHDQTQPARSPIQRSHEIKQEPLRPEMIDGVQTEGTRTTIITAAGVEGNDRPLSHVCERWFSPELQIVILSRCSDLRSGETTMRLRNLDRSEPDAALFQVPPDYIIVDENDRFTMSFNVR